MMNKKKITFGLIVLLFMIISACTWFLTVGYRGASDFTDTFNYMGQGKYLLERREYNPAVVPWEDFIEGKGNLNAQFSYPGQLFSFLSGAFSKFCGPFPALWHVLAFNLVCYLFGCLFCMLFLSKYLKGMELFFIALLTTNSYYVMTACAYTTSDGLGWAIFTLLLWINSHEKKHPILCGIIFGISFYARVHMAIFALFFPIIMNEKVDKTAIFRTVVFVLAMMLSYAGGKLFLHHYVQHQSPLSIAQYAESKGIKPDLPTPEMETSLERNNTATIDSSNTFAWYRGHLASRYGALKQYGPEWLSKGAYYTMGPTSYFFGPVFFIVLMSLFIRWNNSEMYRYAMFAVFSFILFHALTFLLMQVGPSDKMITELKTLGRYFCYPITVLFPVFWVLLRDQVLSRRIMLPKFLVKAPGGKSTIGKNYRMILTGLFLCAVFPGIFTIWGYGAARLIDIPVTKGQIAYEGDELLREELAKLPEESLVLTSRSSLIHVLSHIRYIVRVPHTIDEFRESGNNRLLSALVIFPAHVHKSTAEEAAAWREEIENDVIIDNSGNVFRRTCYYDGKGLNENVRTSRTFAVYVREDLIKEKE